MTKCVFWQSQRANKLTHCTFIHILSAVCSLMALRTGADVVSIHRVGVTQSTFLARIANTGIIQVAQKT